MTTRKNKKSSESDTADDFQTFVRLTLNTLSEQVSDVIKGQKGLEKKLDQLDAKVEANTKTIKDLEESTNFQNGRIEDLEKQSKTAQEALTSHATQLSDTDDAIKKMELKINSLERYTRSFNLRFLNIEEKPREDCRETLCELLKDNLKLKADEDPDDWIENAHRTGPARNDGPRQLIARFHSRVVRNSVIRELRALTPKPDFIVLDDLTPDDLKEKRRVAPAMAKLYNADKKPRFYNGRLYAGKRLVSEATIAKLISQPDIDISQEAELNSADENE